MAITKANYDYRGAILPAPYIRLERMQGGKREGWQGLFSIYATAQRANPAPMQDGEQPKIVDGKAVLDDDGNPVMEPRMVTAPPELLGDLFALHTPYVAGENPFVTLYNAAKADPRLAGAEDC